MPPVIIPTLLGQAQPVHYLPIATTLLSAAFVATLLRRASTRNWPPHLVWWAIGVFFYGLGTAVEGAITLHGNTLLLNRLWYWAGAILGAYPLATGSVYLLLGRRPLAHALTAVSLAYVIAVSVLVFLAPFDEAMIAANPHRPGGRAYLQWAWLPALTVPINLYAVVFLIGGAVYSCVRFLVWRNNPARALGTGLIAVGAILPGIGGGLVKTHGLVEALYVGEFVGLVLIWIGYAVCLRAPAPSASRAAEPEGAPVAA